jgi:enoyl-CoA hydratase
VAPGAHVTRALEVAELIASHPQETMLSDRRALLEGAALSLDDGLALEARIGRERLVDAAAGADRFRRRAT